MNENSKKELVVKRVCYGAVETPVEMREYVSVFSSAVGNRKEWKQFAAQNGTPM